MHTRWNRLSLIPVLAVLLAACCCPCPDRCCPDGGAGGGGPGPTPPPGPHSPAYFKRLRLVNKDKTPVKKAITSATADLQDAAGGSKGSKVLVGAGGIKTSPLLHTDSPVDWTFTGTPPTDVYTVRLSLVFSDNSNYTALVCLASDEPCGSSASPAPCGAGNKPIEFVQSCYWGRGDWTGPMTNQHRLENNRRHYESWTGTGWIMAESCPSGGAPFNPTASSWGKELCPGDYCYRP